MSEGLQNRSVQRNWPMMRMMKRAVSSDLRVCMAACVVLSGTVHDVAIASTDACRLMVCV